MVQELVILATQYGPYGGGFVALVVMVFVSLKMIAVAKHRAKIRFEEAMRRQAELDALRRRQREEEEKRKREEKERKRQEKLRREKLERERLDNEKKEIIKSFVDSGLRVELTEKNRHIIVIDDASGAIIKYNLHSDPTYIYEVSQKGKSFSFVDVCSGPAKGIVSSHIGFGNHLEASKIIINWVKANKGVN